MTSNREVGDGAVVTRVKASRYASAHKPDLTGSQNPDPRSRHEFIPGPVYPERAGRRQRSPPNVHPAVIYHDRVTTDRDHLLSKRSDPRWARPACDITAGQRHPVEGRRQTNSNNISSRHLAGDTGSTGGRMHFASIRRRVVRRAQAIHALRETRTGIDEKDDILS